MHGKGGRDGQTDRKATGKNQKRWRKEIQTEETWRRWGGGGGVGGGGGRVGHEGGGKDEGGGKPQQWRVPDGLCPS